MWFKTLNFGAFIMYELTETEFKDIWEAITLLYKELGKPMPRLEFLLWHYTEFRNFHPTGKDPKP